MNTNTDKAGQAMSAFEVEKLGAVLRAMEALENLCQRDQGETFNNSLVAIMPAIDGARDLQKQLDQAWLACRDFGRRVQRTGAMLEGVATSNGRAWKQAGQKIGMIWQAQLEQVQNSLIALREFSGMVATLAAIAGECDPDRVGAAVNGVKGKTLP